MSLLELIFISFSTFYASALIRIIVQQLPFLVPHNFFIALLGMTFGGQLKSIFPAIDFMAEQRNAPQIVMNIIVPVIMFEASFLTNLESFTIAGVQVVLLVVFTFSLSVGIIGFIVIVVFDYGWGWNHAIIFTSIIVAPGPVVTMAFLRRLIAPLKLQYFLESEAITGNCLAFLIFRFCILWLVSDNLYLKDYIVGLCTSPLFGFIVAKAVAYWMSKTMNDPVNQVCIVIASIYSCYILAEFCSMYGIIAVVFMGVFMTGQRSNMSEKTEKIFLKFLHVISSYFNCNLTLLCGMKLAAVLPTLTWEDCGNIIKIFILVNLIRILVVALLYPLLRKQGYCLSLNNLLVVAVCNIKGVVTVLLAFCLLHEDFKIKNEVKMFALVVSQVVLSLLVNSTITNGVMRYNVFDESKSQSIPSTHGHLREIQQDSIFMFKHNDKYLADADWSIVDKFTRIQHPLLSRTVKPNEVHPYNKHKNTTVDKQAIYRILMMMKCSYWKQYREGILSHDAVKRLLHWSSQALARGNNLIFPSKIQSALTVPKFYKHLKNDVLFKLRDWTLMGQNSKLLQSIIGKAVVCIHFVDLNFTLLHLSNEIIILNPERESIFFWYNFNFILLHGVLFAYRVIRQKKVTIWEHLIALLVFLGIIDLFIMKTISSPTSWSKFLRPLFMTTRFFRVLRVAEVLPFILKIVLEMCEMHIKILLADGFDIARSYIRGRLEVLRLLAHVERDIPEHVLKRFKTVCNDHKLETSRMLAYMQMNYPVISASAKTRQAIRIVITRQLDMLTNMETIRMMRYRDGTVMEKLIMSRMAICQNKWITVMPPSYEDIIASVPWIQNNKNIFSFIMQKGKVVHYKSSEFLVTQSCHPGGLFIILQGIAVLRRSIKEDIKFYTEQVMDYLTTGSVIGEFTFLTGKARHKAVICETNLQVMYIRFKYLWQYIGRKPHEQRLNLSKLEEKMWKVVAIKLAYRLLIAEPDWQILSQNEILCKLVDGVIVDGHANPQSFAHYIQTSDIVLIYGKLVDLASNDVIGGPVFIPKGHGHFSLLVVLHGCVQSICYFAQEKSASHNDGKLRPILYVLPTHDDDVLQRRRFKTRWDLCTVMEGSSDTTLSSGGSSSRPSFVSRDVYLWSSAVSATTKSSDYDTIGSFICETQV